MRHLCSRKFAEAVLKSKLYLETLLTSIVIYLILFGSTRVSRAGLACLSNPCIYGICIDDVNSTFLCYCIDGYTGFLCQTNWDECWSNPCLNGGICVDGIAHYNCTCPQGYQGELCEQNIDECDSNPCHNNGTCIDGPNGYTCVCPTGYFGDFCETDISVCNVTHETRCLNGGLCMEGPGFTFYCACPLGWAGQFCEEAMDECASLPCRNGAVCLDLHANYTCACPFGFTGRNCEVELEMCGDTSPCQNGALCLVEDWLRVCYCVPDFHGDRCQFQYNECLLGPGCRNGGTCIDGVDGYNCSCPPGWSGNFCECLILSENEMECEYLFPPPITTKPPTAVHTVPIWTETKVPKTTRHKKPSSTTQIAPRTTIRKYFYPTECLPIWPHFTIRPPETSTKVFPPIPERTTPKIFWYTKKIFPTQEKTSELTTISKSITTIPTTYMTPKKEANTTSITIKTPATKTDHPILTITIEEIPTITQELEAATPTTPTETTLSSTTSTTETSSTITTEITRSTTATTKKKSTITTTTTETTTTTTTTEIIPTTTTTEIIPTTTTTETIPTTTTTETTPTTTTTKTTPTTTTTETTPTTTTTETTPTTTTTETTPTTTTTETTSTTTTTETTLKTSTETTPTTTSKTTPTTTTITETTPRTTTTETWPLTTTTTKTMPTTTSTTETIPTTKTIIETTQITTTYTTIPTKTKSTTVKTTPVPTTMTTENASMTTMSTRKTKLPTTKISTTQITIPQPTTTTMSSSSLLTTTLHMTQSTPAISTSLPWNCKVTPCLNGGMCLNTTNGQRCVCKPNWEGPFCESKANIKVAGFSGKSYLSHRLTNTHSIKIELTAKTLAPIGVLLYSHLGPHIFMTLYIENGLLKFKFSCGIQTMVLSEVQFHINNGFDLVAAVSLDFLPHTESPFHCVAAVRINNTLAMSGEQLARGPHADSGYAWVYIGGVPSSYIDKAEVPIFEGFIGCMQNLIIDKTPRGIFKDSFDSDGITYCKSLACLSNPCRTGSSCVEYNYTWTCLCPSGFMGRTCEKSVCDNNPCYFGGTCAPFPGSGFICLCPLGKQGLFCEKDSENGYPLFASSVAGLSSFAAYRLPTEVYQDMLLTFKFLPHDMEQISLMIFIGQDGYHGATSDHLAVSFIKGYVVLTWNLGSGPRRIFTPRPVLNTGRFFHTVQIGRMGQRAWLVVDNQHNVTGRSPGKLTQLNTRSVVYLGGHESRNFSLLPHDLPLHTGFSGCLFDVELRTGQMLIKIEKSSPAFSRGVGNCGTSLCNEQSCQNGGGCINHGATFTCLCTDGWFGPTCSMKYNPCDSSRHNCYEGSTCVPLIRGYSCDCPVGKKGKFCEINEELSDIKLTGIRSYLALGVDGIHQYQSCIDIEIRPQSHYGLILYSGKSEGNSFWSLSLQDGFLELRVSPGLHRRRGDILVIKSRRLLSLDKWHRIRTGRYGRRLFLWVEGTVHTGVLLPGENLPPSGTVVYIGGVPDLSKIPVGVTGKVLTPFHGCVRKFKNQWKRIPLRVPYIIDGRNLEDCDGTVCGGDICENGGTCHIDENNKPFCACSKQYIGKRCEYRISCKEINCQNGGRCAEKKTVIPQCHCPNGWGGPFCESAIAVNTPQFGGNSYLLINRTESVGIKKRDTQNKVDVNFIYLNFTTAEANGMLLWSSAKNNDEFIGIGIENGKMKFVWAWEGYQDTVVTTEDHIADGAWHDLAINFDSLNIIIRMDRQIIYTSNKSYPGYPLATDGRFFLGGFPESAMIVNQTLGHFKSGFDGCLQKLAWETQSAIFNFSKFEGENIGTCSPFEM